jgi:RimJ/RimL family protein N-acetyltransferase
VPSDLKLKPPVKIPGYEVMSVTSPNMIDDVLRNKFKLYPRDIWWDTDTMLKKGACLWIGYLNGKFANVTWTRTGDKIRSYFFPLTPGCVLISHSVTIPEYRGNGLYPAILAEIIQALAAQGFERFYIDCSDWNQPSKRVIERVGFSLIGRGKCKRKGQLAWYQDAPPDFTQTNNKEQLV